MIDNYNKVIKDKDYSSYLKIQKDIINYDSTLTDDQKQMQLGVIDLMLSSNPNGEDSKALETQVQNLMAAKQNLIDGVNSAGAVLSADDKSKLEDSVKVMRNTRLNMVMEQAAIALWRGTAISAMISIGISVIAILVIIIAGGSVSSELSSGTIKSLIISPTRRWKIFTAKFLSITSVGLVCSILTLVAAIISYLVFFGSGEMSPYVYASSGVVHAIPFIFVPIFIYSS